jgi:hypothetical protein
MGLCCLSQHGTDERSSWIHLQRHLYRQFLDQNETIHAPRDHCAVGEMQRECMASTLRKTRDLLLLLSQQSRLLGRRGQERKVMATWHLVGSLLEENPSLAALAHLWIAQTQEQSLDQGALQAIIARYHELITAILAVLAQARHDT